MGIRWWGVLVGGLLAGCAASELITSTPTLIPVTDTPTSAITEAPTPTSNHPYFFPTPPLPENAVQSLILSTGPADDCQLPCWHGLRVGESEQAEVEQVLTQILLPPEEYELRRADVADRHDDFDIDPMTVQGYWWEVDEGDQFAAYGLYAYIDLDRGKLVGFREEILVLEFDTPTLGDVLDRLGEPSWLEIEVGGSARMRLYYASGITINGWLEAVSGTYNEHYICFDKGLQTLNVTVTRPFTSLEDHPFNSPREMTEDFPEAQLGMTVDEFLSFVQSDNPCLTISSEDN